MAATALPGMPSAGQAAGGDMLALRAEATGRRRAAGHGLGRLRYGYRLADPGPDPDKAHAAWGRRAHRLEPDPDTAPVVAWMFAQRLAGHSAARITRALNDAGIPCPSAADPGRNPHRAGQRGRCGRWRRSWQIRGIRAGRCGTGSVPISIW
jgi:site-specific DNA recombinase